MPAPNRNAGSQLRKRREKHGFTLRDVQEITSDLARSRQQSQMRITVTKLCDIESRGRIPNIFTLYALSLAYEKDMRALLRLYGIPV